MMIIIVIQFQSESYPHTELILYQQVEDSQYFSIKLFMDTGSFHHMWCSSTKLIYDQTY